MIKKKRRLTRQTKRNYLFVALMLLVPVVHFLVFWVGVNFNSLRLAFTAVDLNTGETTFSWINFESMINLFKTGELRAALVNTLIMSTFNIVFMVPWAIFLTYFLYKRIPMTGMWRTLLFVPSILPAIATTSIFRYIIEVDGPVSQFWMMLTGQELPMLLAYDQYAKWTILAFVFLTNFGGQFVLLTGAMTRIPNELLEAGRLDGAGLIREFFSIVMPLCWPTISMILILNISALFTASGPLLFLTKGLADTQTISYWIYERANAANVGIPAAVGITLTVILFPIIQLAKWGLNKIYADVEF